MCLYEKRGKDCRQRAKYVFQGNWYSDLISFNCIILPHLFSSEWILVVAQKLRLAEAKHSVTGQYQCNQALFSHSGKGENRPCEQSQRSYKTPSQGEGHSYFPKLPPDMQHFLTHSLRFNHEVLQDLSKTQRKERIWIRGAKKKKKPNHRRIWVSSDFLQAAKGFLLKLRRDHGFFLVWSQRSEYGNTCIPNLHSQNMLSKRREKGWASLGMRTREKYILLLAPSSKTFWRSIWKTQEICHLFCILHLNVQSLGWNRRIFEKDWFPRLSASH